MNPTQTLADKHRVRTRNLHDGGPVPPARLKLKDRPKGQGHLGDDRMDAIIGRRGYILVESDGQLFVYLDQHTGLSVSKKILHQIGGTILQEGDREVTASVPPDRIEDVLKLIRVWRRKTNFKEWAMK